MSLQIVALSEAAHQRHTLLSVPKSGSLRGRLRVVFWEYIKKQEQENSRIFDAQSHLWVVQHICGVASAPLHRALVR
jgi:hypothetical protein